MNKQLKQLYTEIKKLEQLLRKITTEKKDIIGLVHPTNTAAAKNLVQYTALRSYDLNDLQERLHENGLSSLTSSESHVLCQVQAILQMLDKNYKGSKANSCSLADAQESLRYKSEKLFGSKPDELPHIMVTFDKNIGKDSLFIEKLLKKGMHVARINCARDDEKAWDMIIANIKKASAETGKECKIYMDLAGPKIRTKILGKGRKNESVKIAEGTIFYITESKAKAPKGEIVIGCTREGIIPNLKENERVLFDDGEIEAVVKEAKGNSAKLEMVRNSKKSLKLKADRGINFPDTEHELTTLTTFDKNCVKYICKNADMIGFSYVKEPADIEELQLLVNEEERKAPIIIKIENTEAINNLPALILQGMQQENFGILVARGDLAVEVGFERLSEIQDEILWFAEAAHTPVIWATEVLDVMHKTGVATRAEMTDAAHAAMAECVMLNKGAYTLEVIDTLKDVLTRNLRHHNKKGFNMPALKIAERLIAAKNNWGIKTKPAPPKKAAPKKRAAKARTT